MSDPLAPFDDDVVAAVATEYGLRETELRDALRRHQRVVRDTPGADDLVYEWRRYLPYDPLVTRTPSAYYCAVLPSVWEEFETYLDEDLGAVRAVHDRQTRRIERDSDGESAFRDAAAMVLSRS